MWLILFMAIPEDAYIELQTRPFYMELITEEDIKLLVYYELH